MKKILMALCVFALIPLAFSISTEKATMEGRYHWNSADADEGDLTAEFTKTGENTYNVDFHFEFRGKDYTYTGTAEGSLQNGALKGTVLNETKRRTFTFSGTCTNGKFSGDHSELRNRGKEKATGSMTLDLK